MEIRVKSVPAMFSEMMIKINMEGKKESSRNGDVLTIQEPLIVKVSDPTQRVLTDPVRQANPYFHLMEVVWMFGGENKPDWIQLFNKRFKEYADANNQTQQKLIHGAYGHRWMRHFNIEQIGTVANMLRNDPNTRRAVIAMWDASQDLGTIHNDLPCNTHIYFRVVDGKLNMTVCNRSNDVVWGMTGANAVHMTCLQELVALEAGLPIGDYIVFTNNAHFYTDLPNANELLNVRYPTLPSTEGYGSYPHVPLLAKGERFIDFYRDCCTLMDNDLTTYWSCDLKTEWFTRVAFPAYCAYMLRLSGSSGEGYIKQIEDYNWRTACELWGVWKA